MPGRGGGRAFGAGLFMRSLPVHFEGLKKYLELWETPFRINPRIVRGLDYYMRTAFEYLAEDGLGAQNAIAAGGRYDGLVEELGGPAVPGVGFAMGLERLALLVPQAVEEQPRLDYFIVYTAAMRGRHQRSADSASSRQAS